MIVHRCLQYNPKVNDNSLENTAIFPPFLFNTPTGKKILGLNHLYPKHKVIHFSYLSDSTQGEHRHIRTHSFPFPPSVSDPFLSSTVQFQKEIHYSSQKPIACGLQHPNSFFFFAPQKATLSGLPDHSSIKME